MSFEEDWNKCNAAWGPTSSPSRYFITPVTTPPQSELNMGGEFWWQFSEPRPNWWFRLWQRLLLGFVWRKIETGNVPEENK